MLRSAEEGGAMTDSQLDGITLARRLTQGPLGPAKAFGIVEGM
jgi:hypothetical protein